MKRLLFLSLLFLIPSVARAQVPVVSVLPANCSVGQQVSFLGTVYTCTAIDTWTPGASGVSLPTTQVSAASYAGADWCAKVQAADAVIGANPGIIVVPSTIAGTCAGTLTFAFNGTAASRTIIFDYGTFTGSLAELPNDGASPPKQAPFRFTGQNTSFSFLSKLNAGSSFLNLTNNAAVAKIDTRGGGYLEIDHLTVEDTSTDCSQFFFDSNTVMHVHDNAFVGTTAAPSACNDVFQFGGNTSSGNDGTTGSEFSGYGTVIRDNYFGKIRQLAIFNNFANNISIVDNAVDSNSGFSTGPILLFSAATHAAEANYIAGNTFEVCGYSLFANFTGIAHGNTFVGNGLWDAGLCGVSGTAGYNWNATAIGNTIIGGTMNPSLPGGVFKNVSTTNYILFSQAGTIGNLQANTCSMSAGTTCTVSAPFGTHCTATVQGATPIAAACNISGTTATVTAASSNSATWAVWTF